MFVKMLLLKQVGRDNWDNVQNLESYFEFVTL